ncbi:pentapeptide repeat-containing protein [Lentzea sp. NPDC005914]|uniref:pentapeptide repeat-containing protein n=1 Tax=Lentzea sp. NPDC005914 TaxID=3154572 RepID=UPI0033E5416C
MTAFVLAGLYALAVWHAPDLLTNQQILRDPQIRPEHRLTAEHNARLIAISIGGALVVGTGLLYTARNYRLAHRGQVTERFTKALERLGSDELYVRIGGVHALEHVIRDSPQHHGDVVEVLMAFIRERTPRTAPPMIDEGWIHPPTDADAAELPTEPAADVQAALTALGCRPRRFKRERLKLDFHDLHLQGANLASAWLRNANLKGAQLRDANLTLAWLRDTNLMGAQLQGARLGGACLHHADLRGALLQTAELSSAWLYNAQLDHAQLQGAELRYALLRKAHIWHANLQDADLTGAVLSDSLLGRTQMRDANLKNTSLRNAVLPDTQLRDADLTGAKLQGADLSQASLSVEQLRSATIDSHTQLPTVSTSMYKVLCLSGCDDSIQETLTRVHDEDPD